MACSGFATRKIEQEYDKTILGIIELLALKLLDVLTSSPDVDTTLMLHDDRTNSTHQDE